MKIIFLTLFLIILGLLLWVSYPITRYFYSFEQREYYEYGPDTKVKIKIDTSNMPSANAVPILMYHGVTNKLDDENTQIDNFIKQMEMIKSQGYQTISVAELDSFFQGKFTLPPKPIIITFDDGRKDSYYPTDEILKKLEFKATIFLATGKQAKNDKFYLNWEDLAKMKDSGRWEIEAHGRNSHDKIVINEKADMGRFL